MKKNLLTLAAVLCCALISSCNKDNGETPAPDNKPTHAVMQYALSATTQMLDMLTLTVEYYDANGQVKSEQMTNTKWTKEIKAKLPATLGVRLKAQLKPGADPSALEKFTAAYGYAYDGYAVNASNEQVGKEVFYSVDKDLDMQGSKLEDWIARHSDGLVKYLFTFGTDGDATKISWE